jgi:Phage major capsid protein E
MEVIDIFRSNAFGVTELTDYINLQPYEPSFFRTMDLFQGFGVATTTVYIERNRGVITLVANRTRSTPGAPIVRDRRDAPTLTLPYLYQEDAITPEEVQDLKARGMTVGLEDVQTVVNDHLNIMRRNDDVTQEFHMVGAFKGIVMDASGDILVNLFTAMGITQTPGVTFNFATDNALTLIGKINTIIRAMEDQAMMGPVQLGQLIAVCGDAFYDGLIGNAAVRESYKDWTNTVNAMAGNYGQPGDFLRENWVYRSFPWQGVWWYNYRGKAPDGTPFIATNKAHMGPNMPGIFHARFGPRNKISGVNEAGFPRYAFMYVDPRDQFVELNYESDVGYYCSRPELLVEVTSA